MADFWTKIRDSNLQTFISDCGSGILVETSGYKTGKGVVFVPGVKYDEDQNKLVPIDQDERTRALNVDLRTVQAALDRMRTERDQLIDSNNAWAEKARDLRAELEEQQKVLAGKLTVINNLRAELARGGLTEAQIDEEGALSVTSETGGLSEVSENDDLHDRIKERVFLNRPIGELDTAGRPPQWAVMALIVTVLTWAFAIIFFFITGLMRV